MSKSVCALAMLAAMGAATPALAQSGERDTVYSTQSYFSGFQYRPFSVQIEGGATLFQGMASQDFHSGDNLGLGFTWRPTSHLPLALRVDGMYEDFRDRPALLGQEAAALGTAVDWGKTRMWGGDVDAELDTLLSPRVRLYFLAGGGWYDRRESFYQRGIAEGVFCGWYFCFTGPALVSFRVAEFSTGMKFEKNAGAGLEFALGGGASLFVDARYERFDQGGQRLDFVPVRIGLRF
jgi:hypothetical protein